MNSLSLSPRLADWLASKGWGLRAHQQAMLDAAACGESALLVAATGAGKTLAGFLPVLSALADDPGEGLHTLYVSPLKALAVDVRRNLLTPIEEAGLDIRVETRTGDTPSDRKARQRARPPHILLTTPESLSLLLTYADAPQMFAGLKCVIIDEVHAFASGKRGDLLSLALARLERLAPGFRRVALSATVAEPQDYADWLASTQASEVPRPSIIHGTPGAPPVIHILLPEGRVPWSGHSGKYAVGQVMAEIETHRTTLVFANTRGLAELLFQELWNANELNLPIGIHHGSLDVEARRRVEEAMASGRLRALVCTSSLDLGVDWGNVDCVIQMGAPKGSARLLQRIGRANHRLDEASEAILVPGNRFEYLEAQAALDAIAAHQIDAEPFREGGLDVLAQHIMGVACAGPFAADALFDEIRSAWPYRMLERAAFDRLLHLISTGGYALKAYDRFRRLVEEASGQWRLTHPRFASAHRLNAGVIVDTPMVDIRFRNGRRLGQVDEYFGATLAPGDAFYFAGISLEVEKVDSTEVQVRASKRPARIPSYNGARMPLTTHLAERVRGFLADPASWGRMPEDVRFWLRMQARVSVLPKAQELLVETFPRNGRHYLVIYSFEGWNAHQSLAMLLSKRMERQGLKPMGFVSSDYGFAIWSLEPVTDPAALLSPDIMAEEFSEWIANSAILRRAFREVAIISGLVERQQPGKRKSGRQVSFSTDLIYDVLRRYEPDHVLLEAAWADARTRLTDAGRLVRLLDRAQATMVHKALDRISPLAVPVMVLIGRESISGGEAEDALIDEAEALAAEAMGAGSDGAGMLF